MKIKGYELKDKTVLEIGKFAILWNCFENEWCDNNCSSAVIKSISNSIQIDMGRQAKFASVLNKRHDKLKWFEPDYAKDSLHPGNARMSREDDVNLMRMFLEQRGENLVCGCLLVIYRIRNNMMHGLKLPSQLDEQIELFRAANGVLESIGG